MAKTVMPRRTLLMLGTWKVKGGCVVKKCKHLGSWLPATHKLPKPFPLHFSRRLILKSVERLEQPAIRILLEHSNLSNPQTSSNAQQLVRIIWGAIPNLETSGVLTKDLQLVA